MMSLLMEAFILQKYGPRLDVEQLAELLRMAPGTIRNMTGEWPIGQVDHMDGNRKNNAWLNLRNTSRKINAQNTKRARADSSTGIPGVSRRGESWRSHIVVDGVKRHLGTFSSPEAAGKAFQAAKIKHQPGYIAWKEQRMDIEAQVKAIIETSRLIGVIEGRLESNGALDSEELSKLKEAKSSLLHNVDTLRLCINIEIGSETRDSFNYITALVVKAGGAVELSEGELREVDAYQLERADPESGGLVLRAFKPQEAPQIEAPSQAPKAIILPEGLH